MSSAAIIVACGLTVGGFVSSSEFTTHAVTEGNRAFRAMIDTDAIGYELPDYSTLDDAQTYEPLSCTIRERGIDGEESVVDAARDLLGLATQALEQRAEATNDTVLMTFLAEIFKELGELSRAEAWFAKAGENGDRNAIIDLVVLFEEGQRIDEAAAWLAKATELGDSPSMLTLADLLKRHGRVAEAEEWYQRAIDARVPEAFQAVVALLKEQGRMAEVEQWHWRVIDTPDP
ncbi:hypothetical protein [Nocardia sp. NPDC051832]|uniref:tetratricopeptide repeat protein n=1 Tax=Nocardia sp. NPDC051832 TaxID=3155673 RepID=UPI0034358C5F